MTGINIITPDVSNDLLSAIVLKIERLMHVNGYGSYICNTLYDPEQLKNCIRELRQRNCDGIFVVGGSAQEQIVVPESLPVVFINFNGGTGSENSVRIGVDPAKVTETQVSVLADRECRHIALLNTTGIFDAKHPIHRGYLTGIGKRGLPFNPDLMFTNVNPLDSRTESRKIILKALDCGLDFDGIAAENDLQALGAVDALRDYGLVPGNDVRVIGSGDSLYAKLGEPSISTIDHNADDMASMGTQAMLEMLNGCKPANRSVVIPHTVIERQTTLGKPHKMA